VHFTGVQLTELYVDTVGNEDYYQEKLERLFPQLKIVVTSKADVKFPIVSAASICAKVNLVSWILAVGAGANQG
jgi:ribonuclease H2 subunit A